MLHSVGWNSRSRRRPGRQRPQSPDILIAPSVNSSESERRFSTDKCQLVVTLLGLIGAVGIGWMMSGVLVRSWPSPSTFDDAYMFCRYADHLLAGMGMCWNPNGPATYGCTSLLYTFWVTLVRAVTRIEFWRVTLIASWLAGLGSIVAMMWMCRRAAIDQAANSTLGSPLRSWFAAIALIALVILPRDGFSYHVGTGMDTTLAIACNALAIGAAMRFRWAASWHAIMGVALLAYVAFAARPDSLIYVTLFPILLIWLRAEDRGRRVADLVRFICAIGVLLAADTAIKWALFGNPLPIPFYAKTGDLYAGYIGAEIWNPVTYTRRFITDNIAAVLIVIVGFRMDAWRVAVAAFIPIAFTFAYLGTATQIMGFSARFYYPALPLLVLVAYYILDQWLNRPKTMHQSRPFVSIAGRIAALAVLGVALYPASAWAETWYKQWARAKNPNLSQAGLYESVALPNTKIGAFDIVRVIADFVNAAPKDAVWAMSEHGYISAAATDVTLFDLAGLHDPATMDGGSVTDRLFERRPDVIWFPTRNYTGMVTAIETNDVFIRDYLNWPGAFKWGIAILRDSPYREGIESAMNDAWKKLYDEPVPPPARWLGDAAGRTNEPDHLDGATREPNSP